MQHCVELQAHDENLDVCLLRLPIALQIEPLVIDTRLPRVGEKWSAFGYPVHKLKLGHALNGTIQQTLEELIHGVDLDLSVSADTCRHGASFSLMSFKTRQTRGRGW